ncbi:hypothetical protein AB837_00401 [bacterium AB1]|nr:hypothetical protein AB837_00401 [bacterium AB1]
MKVSQLPTSVRDINKVDDINVLKKICRDFLQDKKLYLIKEKDKEKQYRKALQDLHQERIKQSKYNVLGQFDENSSKQDSQPLSSTTPQEEVKTTTKTSNITSINKYDTKTNIPISSSYIQPNPITSKPVKKIIKKKKQTDNSLPINKDSSSTIENVENNTIIAAENNTIVEAENNNTIVEAENNTAENNTIVEAENNTVVEAENNIIIDSIENNNTIVESEKHIDQTTVSKSHSTDSKNTSAKLDSQQFVTLDKYQLLKRQYQKNIQLQESQENNISYGVIILSLLLFFILFIFLFLIYINYKILNKSKSKKFLEIKK